MTEPCEVLVIGGGPGGSAAATLLARWGHSVVVLEKEFFPRYHIGESLLPANWKVFEAMGVAEEIRAAKFIPKGGGTFVWGQDREPWTVYFGEIGGQPAARQVKRAEFDKILLDNAARHGVDVRQGCTVKDFIFEGGRMVGAIYEDSDGVTHEQRARWVVDASGQAKLIARRFGLVEYHPDFKNTAIWSYWENGKRQPGYDSGNVLYVTHEHGWFWYIPLEDEKNLISVGTVVRPSGRALIKERGFAQFYHDMIAATDVIPDMLADATEVAEARVISDYSYCCTSLSGPGWMLVGDAACFVDPILSSGVQLASFHGMLAALVINTASRQPQHEADAMAYYERLYKNQYNTFVNLCQNMYDTQKATKDAYFAGARRLVQPTVTGNSSHDNVGDRLAFISLISGTGPEETRDMLMNFLASRQQAGTLDQNDHLSFSEEALSMLFNRVHRAELERGKLARIGEDEVLAPSSVLRIAPQVQLAEDFFLPGMPMQNTLQRRETVKNRFGDRFEPTSELRTLLESIDGQRPYRDVLQIFAERFGATPQECERPFQSWIELLADNAVVEWHSA